jgi:hypothetical protein
MAQLYDARTNEFSGSIDVIGGQTYTDARTASGTLGALNAELVMDLHGKATAAYDVRSAAAALTLTFEGTIDGTNYITLTPWALTQNIGGTITQEVYVTPPVVATTIAAVYTLDVSGFRRIRARVSAYTSGNVTVVSRASIADSIIYQRQIPTTLVQSVTAAANTGYTVTLPAVTGLFHYITRISQVRNATAALAGTATLVTTTTNLPGTLAWSVGNAMVAGGTQLDIDEVFTAPLKSSASGTATTIVVPAPGAAVLTRTNVYYYVGA